MTTSTRTGGRAATQGVIPGRFALSVGKPSIPEPAGFAWTSLASVARLESGHTPSRSRSDYWDGTIPWIGIRDATANHGRVITDTEQHVTQLGLDNSSARLLPAGTVCLSRTASVGYVVTMGVPMATSQDFVNWVCGPGLSSRYLHYILLGEQESVRRFAHGTTHQTMYYPEAKALHALLPKRSVQDAISEVLRALDDKIAANERTVATALDLAAALHSPAVDPDLSPITLGELADIGALQLGDGYRTKRSEHGKPGLRILRAGDVRAGRIFPDGDDFVSEAFRPQIGKKASQAGDILLTTKGTVGRVAVVPRDVEQVVYSPQVCYFRIADAEVIDPGYLAGWFLSADLQAQAELRMYKSDMAPYINLQDIRTLRVSLPPIDEQRRQGAAQSALLDIQARAHSESRKLAELLHTLLPTLMSGGLRVKDAEGVVEEVV